MCLVLVFRSARECQCHIFTVTLEQKYSFCLKRFKMKKIRQWRVSEYKQTGREQEKENNILIRSVHC